MSQVNPYASIEKRSFQSALQHLLETEYGLLGGGRILALLVEDVQTLVNEFYPTTERATSGDLLWACTANEGKKAEVGKPTEAYQPIMVRLPLVVVEELHSRTQPQPTPPAQKTSAAQAREQQRLVRLVKAAAEQGGLLTLAELSVILNRSYEAVRKMVRGWEAEHAELLPMKGYIMDQGSSPTHKGAIIRLSEKGLEPPDIARETKHSLKSVTRYLKDYERVRMLLHRGSSPEEISTLIGRGLKVVLEYVQIAQEYHPELFPAPA